MNYKIITHKYLIHNHCPVNIESFIELRLANALQANKKHFIHNLRAPHIWSTLCKKPPLSLRPPLSISGGWYFILIISNQKGDTFSPPITMSNYFIGKGSLDFFDLPSLLVVNSRTFPPTWPLILLIKFQKLIFSSTTLALLVSNGSVLNSTGSKSL